MSKQVTLSQWKIEAVTAGIERSRRRMLEEMPASNANTICEHILAEVAESNIKDSTRAIKIWVLVSLSKILHHKQFREMTRDDLLAYLNSLRKSEADDPTHKWIGNYNFRVRILVKFFRWLYNPNEHIPRNRKSPKLLNGIRQLPRKEKSKYRPEDLWTSQEQLIFLKYCPSKRDRTYLAMDLDTSARPHELMKLNIADLQFKIDPSSGKQFCEITVSGKTGTRTLPLIDSIPYVKDWLAAHPLAANPLAPLFVSLSDRNLGSRLNVDSLWSAITKQKQYFEKLLSNPDIPSEDKEIIKSMLRKPWNPYVFRHTALTAKAQILSEMNLKHHAGWSSTSKMAAVYLHYLGAESANALLEAKGIIAKDKNGADILQSKPCPHCREPNTQHSKFCSSCSMVLTYDGYLEAVERQKSIEAELGELRAKVMDRDYHDKAFQEAAYGQYLAEQKAEQLRDFLVEIAIRTGMQVPKGLLDDCPAMEDHKQ